MTTSMTVMGQQGVNLVLPYKLNAWVKTGVSKIGFGPKRNKTSILAQMVLDYFDAALAHGVKVMLDMSEMDINQPCCHGPDWPLGVLLGVQRSVELVKKHPALLGYYICDDCCTTSKAVSAQAQVYNTIKMLDPYHITAGAVFRGCNSVFNDVPSSHMTPTSDDTVQVLSGLELHGKTCSGVQPKTQLSLDFVLVENYNPSLDAHIKGDKALRSGMRFEPVANCPGSFILEERIKRHKPPRNLETSMWAGVVEAGTANQLVFAGALPAPIKGTLGNWWGSKIGMMLYARVNNYRAKLQVILPSLQPTFGFPQPAVRVTSVVALLPDMKGMPKGKGLAARAWQRQQAMGWCGHLIVVSGLEQSAAMFSLQLGGSFPLDLPNQTALRLFDADYKVAITADGNLTDWIGAGDTNIYELGSCIPLKEAEAPASYDTIVV